MRIPFDKQLKIALGAELCAIMDGLPQDAAAQRLKIAQPYVSNLRRGNYNGFSVGRLLRLIASQHYNVEIHLRRIDRPYAPPPRPPTLTVVRYDRFERPSLSTYT